MKFLCVACDQPMKLLRKAPPDRGSLSLVYGCPSCDHEMAMLTNPYETQLVGALGVKLGGATEAARASANGNGNGTNGDGSKCPFAAMARQMGFAPEAGQEPVGFPWSAAARERLERIPDFARPMAKTGIEKFAQERGLPEIDEQVLDEAREYFGM